MAKETLIRTLSEFKEEKLIEIDAKGISIKNNKKLECIFE
ncbi:MAG: winged helix-turn-helix domain-containing protein [Saprospiraceae bacterium]|nr:winged helix-turn-helix domain-containing protein [Candidatus Vicinibacter affinis]